jgi:hypothetical protein
VLTHSSINLFLTTTGITWYTQYRYQWKLVDAEVKTNSFLTLTLVSWRWDWNRASLTDSTWHLNCAFWWFSLVWCYQPVTYELVSSHWIYQCHLQSKVGTFHVWLHFWLETNWIVSVTKFGWCWDCHTTSFFLLFCVAVQGKPFWLLSSGGHLQRHVGLSAFIHAPLLIIMLNITFSSVIPLIVVCTEELGGCLAV